MTRSTKNLEATSVKSLGTGAEKSAFVHRLQTILTHWPSADRLARVMGVSPSAFRKWLKGEAEPSRERLVALARAAGVGIAWLAEGEGPEPSFVGSHSASKSRASSEETQWDDFGLLPRPSAENGLARPVLALHRDWVRSACQVEPADLGLEIAACQSMSPTIGVGDALLIDTVDRGFRSVGIYVLEIDGQRLVRRVQRRHDGSLVLISDNQAYQPDTVDPAAAEKIVVIGRVVWAGGPVA